MTSEKPPAPEGVLLLDKPAGVTSHDVVRHVRRALRVRRVGHGGTLDPMATGLLVVAVGRSTRMLGHVSDRPKTYAARVRLGQWSDTDDADGRVHAGPRAGVARHPSQLDPVEWESVLDGYRGPIMQRPSDVSAIRIDGRRAYARVRAGEEVDLPARPVTIHSLSTRHGPVPSGPDVVDVDIEVTCSSGTYVRALARDIGEDLGTGAHLVALRRTAVGDATVRQALAPTADPASDAPRLSAAIIAPARAARMFFPVSPIPADRVTAVAHGVRIPIPADPVPQGGIHGLVSADGGDLLALAESDGAQWVYRAVFA